MLVIIYSKLLILAVRQKDTKSYRPPLVKAACHKQVFLCFADPGTREYTLRRRAPGAAGHRQNGEIWSCKGSGGAHLKSSPHQFLLPWKLLE